LKCRISISVFVLISACNLWGQGYIQNNWPERVILSLTPKPATSIAVTWRTQLESINPSIQIAKAMDWTDYNDNPLTYNAASEEVTLDTGYEVFYYSVIVKNLEPNTEYIYRVGSDSVWCEWNQFKTANNQTAPFEFVYFGDAQHDVMEHCSHLFRKAYNNSPNAAFWLSSGDLVDRPQYDYQLGEFFEAASFIPRVIPMVLACGNHEYKKWYIDEVRQEAISDLWRHAITQPASSIEGLDETVFYIDYQGVRFIFLNGTEKRSEQAAWLREVLSENNNLWTIVSTMLSSL